MYSEQYILELEQLCENSRNGRYNCNESKSITDEIDQVLLRYFSEYINVFFTGTALQDMICYMCNMCSIEISDPIPATLNMFLTSNVSMTVTGTGLVPFRDVPMAIYPYQQMTEEQGNFLDEYIFAIERLRAGTVSTQMGGGMVVSLSKRAGTIHYISPTDVLGLFCEKVINTESHTSPCTRYAMCDIVLQIIGSSVGISRSTLSSIYTKLRDDYEKQKASLELDDGTAKTATNETTAYTPPEPELV